MPKYSTLKPAILLHVCCGTCALYPYFLLKKDFDVTFFYYNPNIYPRKEYVKRLEGVKIISRKYSIPLIIGKYDTKKWTRLTADFKDEPEGGSRCSLCFRIRLDRTADTAKRRYFNLFGTTLTISPHKDHRIINSIGLELASAKGISFHQANLKKKDGFKKTMELSKKLNLYRQNYCGCIYSKKQNGKLF
jgi:predicted adenine nucleotide alpha hydrolase (AANH) superfamily ATPase